MAFFFSWCNFHWIELPWEMMGWVRLKCHRFLLFLLIFTRFSWINLFFIGCMPLGQFTDTLNYLKKWNLLVVIVLLGRTFMEILTPPLQKLFFSNLILTHVQLLTTPPHTLPVQLELIGPEVGRCMAAGFSCFLVSSFLDLREGIKGVN